MIERMSIRLAVVVLGLSVAHAQEREEEYEYSLVNALETRNLRLLYFNPTETYLAPYAAQCFENSLLGQQSILGWTPDGDVTVLLKDFGDYGNAAASANPRNRLLIDIAPISLTFETFTASERIYTLMNHELVHVATMDQASEQDMRWRRFFHGKVFAVPEHPETIFYQYLTTPRTAVPRWYLEGSAVFVETWMAGGVGRAQGPYDEMVFRAMVRDDAHFYSPLGLAAEGMRVDFQVGVNAYLYGTRFMTYLAYEYSPEKLIAWLSRTNDSERWYAAQFRKVFGKTLENAWQDWIDFEKSFQQRNLAAIHQYPTTRYEDLSSRPLGSVSRAFHDPETNTLYAGLRYPGVVAHIAAISLDDGKIRKLVDIKGPQLYRVTSLAYDQAGKTLFYTADNNAYRDLMAVDIETGKSRRLIEDGRIGELVFNPIDRSLWGVRHLNGIVTLVRLPPPYAEWNQIHSFEYGQVLYDLDISPDGTLLSASMGEINGSQHLRVMEIDRLMGGDTTPLRTTDFFGLAVPESFVFSQDGRYLYGSSYYTGVSNVFRYEVATGDIEAVSNAETGFFRPVPVGGDDLIVFDFTGQGFMPAKMKAEPLEDVSATTFLGQQLIQKYPVLKDWQVGSPADVPIDELIERDGPYRSRRELSLESVYPLIEGYQDVAAVGVHANISDPIGFDKIGLTASVSPTSGRNEMLHAQATWRHRAWTTDLRYNYANFYDLFGPTKVSLKGYSGEVRYERPLIYDLPRELDLEVRAGYWGNLQEVPYAQDIDVTTDDQLVAGSARLDYSFVRRSLGAVDDEKGFRWSAVAGGNYSDDSLTPYLFGNFDFGFALPLKHSSIWLRTAAGGANGDDDDPFANFFFGGFRNNWVDHQEVRRYRDTFSFPGFGINDFGGQTFVRSILEWNLPPKRFRRLGARDFFVSWARPAIFASALVTDPDGDDQDYYNIGAQIDFQMSVYSRLDMMLSFGYAWGATDGDFDRTEFMASLKIL